MENKRIKSIDLIHSIMLDKDSSTQIEEEIYKIFHSDLKKYSQKIRSIIFNLKSSSSFREHILTKKIPIKDVPNMSPAEIDSTLWDPIFKKATRIREMNAVINKLAA